MVVMEGSATNSETLRNLVDLEELHTRRDVVKMENMLSPLSLAHLIKDLVAGSIGRFFDLGDGRSTLGCQIFLGDLSSTKYISFVNPRIAHAFPEADGRSSQIYSNRQAIKM